jgi:hypothetical protein
MITIHRTQSPLCLLFLVCLGGYIVNSLDCYSYRLIGKLTAFLQLQEFSLRNKAVDYSTSAARRARSPWNKSRQHPRQGWNFTYQFECWWDLYHFKNTYTHTNKIDHDVIFVWFHTSFSNGKTQTLKTVFERPLVVHWPPTRHVHCAHTSLARKITRLYLLSGPATTFLWNLSLTLSVIINQSKKLVKELRLRLLPYDSSFLEPQAVLQI